MLLQIQAYAHLGKATIHLFPTPGYELKSRVDYKLYSEFKTGKNNA